MQMVLNELSANFPLPSISEAKQVISQFINTYSSVKNIINNDTLLIDKDYNSFLLADNYRIEQWRNDASVDIEQIRKFRSMLNKSASYNACEFADEEDRVDVSEFTYDGKESYGCKIAYEADGVVISFLSEKLWAHSTIKGIYRTLDAEANVLENHVEIMNVSNDNNIRKFKEKYNLDIDKINEKTNPPAMLGRME